ncbi:ArsR/SmtB family transcription factor [Granulicella arctica]|uniref:ArsR family transcriptional regulator n=1 Tax=Granulicella arctica TaxID=940613 RepID=A0A7Y9PF09_9BACT|nr:metalloregulator ArsR/SmtB family transcription factor [Granulicella arctica]NYF78710.1 ArsR family transcriptional regulator [Granulicella arctica]
MAGTRRRRLPEKQVQLIVKALADPRRYEILKNLGKCAEPMACGAVLACAEVSAATLSHHMKELEIAGLVEPVREGKFVSYTLQRDVLESFLDQVRGDLV